MTDNLPGFELDILPSGRKVFIRIEDPAAAIFEAVIRAFHPDNVSMVQEFRYRILPKIRPMEASLLYLMLKARDADEPTLAPTYAVWLRALGFPESSPGSVRKAMHTLRRKLGPGWWAFFERPEPAGPVTVVRGYAEKQHEASPRRLDGPRGLERQADTPDMTQDAHDWGSDDPR